jgi:hypothetical protein
VGVRGRSDVSTAATCFGAVMSVMSNAHAAEALDADQRRHPVPQSGGRASARRHEQQVPWIEYPPVRRDRRAAASLAVGRSMSYVVKPWKLPAPIRGCPGTPGPVGEAEHVRLRDGGRRVGSGAARRQAGIALGRSACRRVSRIEKPAGFKLGSSSCSALHPASCGPAGRCRDVGVGGALLRASVFAGKSSITAETHRQVAATDFISAAP